MEQQEIPCRPDHKWGGKRMIELLDPNKFEPQHPELWGVPCDCKKLKIVSENKCGCIVPRWEFQTIEN